MSSTSPRAGGPPVEIEVVLAWIAVAVIVALVAIVEVSVHLALALDGGRAHVPGNPVVLVIVLLRGGLAWPAGATVIAVVLGLLVVALLCVGVWKWQGFARRHVDRAARWMGRGKDIGRLSGKQAAATARRLGVQAPGLALARTVATGEILYMGWEDVSVDVWGPRTGKTTSRAVPSILDAPGAVLATSNKRDLADATREVRAQSGRVWVFDPQGIAGEQPTWWWNPLSYVTDEVKALELADVIALASRDVGARTDAFFDTAGQNAIAALLLAAASDRRELTQVYIWLSEETDEEPVKILQEHGYTVIARALQAQINQPEKQRGGVFGTAREMCAFMVNRQAMAWVTPPRYRAPEFKPSEFVATTQTLYSLSKEGKAGAGPLVTGLTLAVCEAAEALAKTCQGGRLPTPMLCVLDEAANVCRWRKLPDLYSHYGSRGILLMTILQSWSQGVEVWGREGMRKLWSAATVKVYGGGVTEVEFLEELSKLIGEYDAVTRSDTRSYGQGGRSSNRSMRQARILDVADLAAMPQGRVVVMASGARPTLAVPIPWMAGPQAAKVRASLLAHDPVNHRHAEVF